MEESYFRYLEAICIKNNISKNTAKLLKLLMSEFEKEKKKTLFIPFEVREKFAKSLNLKQDQINKMLRTLCDGNILMRMRGLKSTYLLQEDIYTFSQFKEQEEIIISVKRKKE